MNARTLRATLRVGVAALALASTALFIAAPAAYAAPQGWISDEISGNTIADRAAAQALETPWRTAVEAKGGNLERFLFTSNGVISGVIGTASNGATVSLERTRYSINPADPDDRYNPVYVGPSANPGTATCSGTNGTQLQDLAPRPTSLVGGAGCAGAGAFGYSESGGAGENDTRDAVEFTFGAPVLAFGAWFGDLETRTVPATAYPALLRLYDADGVLLSQTVIAPDASTDQSQCGTDSVGCGNRTTRWIGFEAEPSEPVSRVVVIVGDNTPTGANLGTQGVGIIGPTVDVSTASMALAKTHAPLADTNGDGRIGAGDRIDHSFQVTNTGTRVASGVAIDDPGASNLACPPPPPLSNGGVLVCTGDHILTQLEVDLGSYVNTATAAADVPGGRIVSAPASDTVQIPAAPGLDLALAAAPTTYSAGGDVITFTHTLTNTGNVTVTGPAVLEATPGSGAFTSDCDLLAATPIAPGGTASCTSSYTIAAGDLGAGPVRLEATAIGTAAGAQPAPVQSEARNATAIYEAIPPVPPAPPTPPVPSPPGQPGGDQLPGTGSAVSAAAVLMPICLLLLATGAVLGGSRRKRRPDRRR
jgi:uncharacterized repeat protein (TIGR01451 family)